MTSKINALQRAAGITLIIGNGFGLIFWAVFLVDIFVFNRGYSSGKEWMTSLPYVIPAVGGLAGTLIGFATGILSTAMRQASRAPFVLALIAAFLTLCGNALLFEIYWAVYGILTLLLTFITPVFYLISCLAANHKIKRTSLI